MRDAYKKEIEEAYTKVPREALPRLTAFVEEHLREGLDEISSFILYTLHENAAYTLTPGWTPLNEDVTEHFLFGSGRGYCEHFAAAATLMYRLYGIPARYAAGYAVPPSGFEIQEDGTYKAKVTDEMAHAWTEIFLDDYGWTPNEVTPAPDGSSAADYPGFDSQIYQRMVSERRQERSEKDLASGLTQNRISGGASLERAGEQEEKDGGQETADLEKDGKRRLMLEVLHAAGILLEYDGSEEEFAFKLEEEVKGVSRKEIKRFQELVCRAAYGSGTLTEEQEQFVRQVYMGTAAVVYGKLKWNQKLVFRYLKCFV